MSTNPPINPYDPSTPPPPPPKQTRTTHAPPRSTSTSPPAAPPPAAAFSPPHSPWLPPQLLTKPTGQLAPLLGSPALLAALTAQHRSLRPAPVEAPLQATLARASQLRARRAHVQHLRAATQGALLRLHGLERQWRATQARMDRELAAWSPGALYRRLGAAEREMEDEAAEVERGFLAGGGAAEPEAEVARFVARFLAARRVVARRRERRERWDEGRVGGWR